MTTDIKVFKASDVSVENEVVNLRDAQGHVDGVLSAASFVVSGLSSHSLGNVLEFICGIIAKRIPGYEVWLFLGSSTWQPDTRIVRYRKLWGALKHRGYKIGDGSELQESVVSDDGKLRFFGAVRLSDLSIVNVISLLLGERCSYIAALPGGDELKSSLDKGWSGNIKDDLGFCYRASKKNWLLFKQIGEFDDREWGFVSIGSPELIEKLLG